MGIFHKFTDTIFLKDDTNIDKQIEALKQIPNSKNDSAILHDIKLLEIGKYGEDKISFELKHANIGMYVLRDINILYEDLNVQIDYVIVTKGSIYLVECKNLIGNIQIDSYGNFSRTYEINGKTYNEGIYSPYSQAKRHVEILKKRWFAKNKRIITLIGEKDFDKFWYKPLVVLANPKGILNMTNAPEEIKNHVVRVDNLIDYLENDIKKYPKDQYMGQKKMKEQAEKILSISNNDISFIADKYCIDSEDNRIKEKLIEYRKLKAKEKNIPAYVIFKNDELDKIIKSKPKDLHDLEKILSSKQLKYNGKDILDIINNK